MKNVHIYKKIVSMLLSVIMLSAVIPFTPLKISAAADDKLKPSGMDTGTQIAFTVSSYREFEEYMNAWEAWDTGDFGGGETRGTTVRVIDPNREPVAVLTRDIEFPSTHNAYDNFSGEIRGDGHTIYAPAVIFDKLTDALLINIQFSVKRTSAAYSSRGLADALIANYAESSTFINCFSTDTVVPMVVRESGCSFINCYTQYRTNPDADTDPIGIPYLPDSQMKTRAFAYIMNHPSSTQMDSDLAKKVEPKFSYQINSVPIPIQKTPDAAKKEYTKEPLEFKNSAYQISNASDLLSLAILTKLGMLQSMQKGDALFVQTQNIAMTESANKGFVSIGTPRQPFTATYDGQGFMITKLASTGGLFNYTSGAKIVNLAVENANILENDTYNGIEDGRDIYTGILINAADNTTIDRCYVTGKVTGKYVGGMIGYSNFMTMTNCYSMADITTSNTVRGGGLTGYDFKGDYKNVYVAKPFSRVNHMGGLFGYLFAPYGVENCYYNMGSNANEDEENFAYESGDISNAYAIAKPTDKMRTNLFANELNSDPVDMAFGWKGSVNDKFPVLYGIGVGTGVVPPKDCVVTLKQPKGATVTLSYNGEDYTKDGTKITLAEGSQITLSCKPDYTYDFLNYTAKPGKGEIKKFKENSFTVTDSTEISADVKKNGATVTFSYNTGGSVEYDAEDGIKGDSVTVEKGKAFEFKISTEYGYKIKSVTYTAGNIKKISETRYRIQKVSKDGTVNIEFVNTDEEQLKEVVDEKTGELVVKVKKPNDLINEISRNDGNTLQADMGSSTMLNGKILDELYGEDVNIELVMKNYRWKINGQTLTRTKNRNLNMGVNIGKTKSKISDKATDQLKDHSAVIGMSLNHSGDFPFTGYLTVNVGSKYQYQYANLFYYNPKTKVFEFQECNDVDDDGNVTFRFTHASDYAIVIENEPIWDLAAGEGQSENIFEVK